jgi:altronate dehydratase large subunit
VAGGAQVLVFGTGRGAPQGFPLTPVVKVSGNPATCRHLRAHIDVDVSAIVARGQAVAVGGRQVAAAVQAAAGGRLSRAERTGYDRMVDIYTRGPFV